MCVCVCVCVCNNTILTDAAHARIAVVKQCVSAAPVGASASNLRL